MQITNTHIQQFEQNGAVTLDGPFDAREIAAASEKVTRLAQQGELASGTSFLVEPMLLDLIQHPALEEAAKRFLHADEVEFAAWLAAQKESQPGAEFRLDGEHVDVSYNRAALQAVPRKMMVTFLLWLTDVTLDRGPFMYRAGSHRQMAEHWGDAPAQSDDAIFRKNLPSLPFAEPTPILARAGQISAVTTSLVHSGSSNTGTLPRQVMFINFQPKGVEVRFGTEEAPRRAAYLRKLQTFFRPERRHLLPM